MELKSRFQITPVVAAETNSSVIDDAMRVPSDRDMERELIRYDMNEVGDRIGLSDRQQKEYVSYLEEAADRYNLPMILIHSIAYVESSYDPSAIHPQIRVNGKQTRALGLTGIVWEYNKDLLIKEGIASSRLELTEPRANLLASAAIVHRDIERILTKEPKIPVDKFFDELIRRYYGAYNDTYKTRMLAKMKDVASRQWIRRTVKNIILSRIEEEKEAEIAELAVNDSTSAQ